MSADQKCGPLLDQLDAQCAADPHSAACEDITSRAFTCLRQRSLFLGKRARVLMDCVIEHQRDPSPCEALRADFVRDTARLLDNAKLEEGWQQRVKEACEAPLGQMQKCHALAAVREGQARLVDACEEPLSSLTSCVRRVACPARFEALRACIKSSGGKEEACEVEVDRWVACTINTELETLRGLGIRAGRTIQQ